MVGSTMAFMALIHAGTGIYNGERNRKTQEEVSRQNHQNRMAEQQSAYENACKQIELQRFYNNWPLYTMPEVMRQEQMLQDQKKALRVIFAKSEEPVFDRFIYPRIEQGLQDFIGVIRNCFGYSNILFSNNVFRKEYYGGAVENVHYALGDMPVLIVDTKVVFDEVCLSLSVWGVNGKEVRDNTIFRIPYQPPLTQDAVAVKYYQKITLEILSYLKFMIGHIYDTYNLLYFDNKPMLTDLAEYEKRAETKGQLLQNEAVAEALTADYAKNLCKQYGKKEMLIMLEGKTELPAERAAIYAI